MAFIGTLPEAPSFGQTMGRSLGQGLAQGIEKGTNFAEKMATEKYKLYQKKNLISKIKDEDKSSMPKTDHYDEFIQSLPEIEKSLQRDLEPDEVSQLWNNYSSINQETKKTPSNPYKTAEDYATIGEHDLSRIEMEKSKDIAKDRRIMEEREFLPKKEYLQHAGQENFDFLKSIKKIENDIPNTEYSLSMIEDALGDANKWAAAKDWLAEKSGFVGFRSAPGAELDSAIKTHFLSDLASIQGGKLNQFLEKQLRDAYMKAGQDPISNQKILVGMKMKAAINRLKIEKTRELENSFIEKQGYLPPGFESMVNKAIKPEVNKIEKNSIDTLHNMSKIESVRDKIFRSYLNPGEILMMDGEGNPFAVKKKEVSLYKEQGYIPLGEK